MLDIKAAKREYLDCFKNNILSIAKHYHKDCELMCLNSWGFKYEEHGYSDIVKKLSPYISEEAERYIFILEKFHGIKLTKYKKESFHEKEKLIMESIERGYPAIFQISGYHCPWSITYHKYHIDHFVLAIGYDKEENVISCIDPFYIEDVIPAKPGEIIDFIESIFTVDFIEPDFSKEDVYDALLRHVRCLLEIRPSAFKMMRNLAEDIGKINFLEKQYSVSELYAVPVIRRFKEVEIARESFMEVLKYIDRKYQSDMNKFIENINDAMRRWGRVKLLVGKIFLTNRVSEDTIESIKESIYEASQIEESTAIEMIGYLEKLHV